MKFTPKLRTLTESDVYEAIESGQRNITTDLMDLRPWKYIKYGVNAVGTRIWMLSSESKKYNARMKDYHRTWRNHHRKGTLNGDREIVRATHRRKYRPFKKILDPAGLTCLHHNWIEGTSAYSGVAVVEKEMHEKYHEFVQPLELKDDKIIVHGLNGEEEP